MTLNSSARSHLSISSAAAAAAATTILAMAAALVYRQVGPGLARPEAPVARLFGDFFFSSSPAVDGATPSASYACDPAHAYTTSIVSLDPLLIYIEAFLAPADMAALLAAGEPAFAPSEVVKHGRKVGTADRTSQSAGLPRDDAAVACVLARARRFMGTLLDDARDEIGPPQLVRYTTGQRFNIHHDWYEAPQPARWENQHRGERWNRLASFFAVLQDNCTGGETYFPHVKPMAGSSGNTARDGEATPTAAWRVHEDGGVAFRPVRGNALFWVNLHANGTGDSRTLHAGLPLQDGLKTAMNIWPRQYYD